MDVLIAGSGGREDALAWKLRQSAGVGRIYIAPGNGGTRRWGENVPIAAEDTAALLTFAQEKRVDLTVVGPEAPLAAGIVDAFQAARLPIFGPTQAAAQLEASKAFAKSFMREQGIPTAEFGVFNEYEAARDFLAGAAWPDGAVVKASGLAAGKGVIVCDDLAQADRAAYEMLRERPFGAAGDTIIIEERLIGPELSLLAFADGRTLAPMLPARDHKRFFDGDQGPNTGGMGAYAPPPDVDEALLDEIMRRVMQPALDGLAARGTPYVGVLYAGLMLTAGGLKALEFNCRFGDPETQVILPLLDGDLAQIMLACVRGELAAEMVRPYPGVCAAVVMAAPGYPGSYPKGLPISGLEDVPEDMLVFHAGTVRRDGRFLTNGGRVLAVSARGEDLATAAARAYEGVSRIHFEGAHYRKDIGVSLQEAGQG
ncbi:MAG TPA: phosphoribosylamine--glycine ligase [Chromatiales bacterium]|nr:phosphoribosylamine--glycine ligase [Chromatiales bacterium]